MDSHGCIVLLTITITVTGLSGGNHTAGILPTVTLKNKQILTHFSIYHKYFHVFYIVYQKFSVLLFMIFCYRFVKFRFLVRVSYLEIYNEEVRDLLGKDQEHRLEVGRVDNTRKLTSLLLYFYVLIKVLHYAC